MKMEMNEGIVGHCCQYKRPKDFATLPSNGLPTAIAATCKIFVIKIWVLHVSDHIAKRARAAIYRFEFLARAVVSENRQDRP
jgi:hypothetical protein